MPTKTIRSFFALSAALALSFALPACAGDEAAGDETATARETPAEANVYYAIEPDFRRCAAPACGGFFVRRVNAESTRCADGELAESCYVAAIDLDLLELDEWTAKQVRDAASAGRLLARGDLAPGDDDLALLAASEAWISPGDAPASGTFARVTDRGVMCVVAPCPSLHEAVLNFQAERDLAELDFGRAGLADKHEQQARDTMRRRGVIVVGEDYVVSGPGGEAPGVNVSRVYFSAPTRGQDLPL